MATYTPQTKIAGASLGSADAWYDWAKANGAARLPDVRLYLDTVYEWAPKCSLKAHAIVTQSIHETGDGTVGWVSYWWRQRCNPAGIGITGDTAQNNASKTFADGREAALAHIVHAYLYVHGTDLPAGLSTEMDPRWRNAASVDTIPGQKTTLASFGAALPVITWAADPKYGELWAAWLNRTASLFEGTVVTPPVGGTEGRPDVATYTTTIPGLPGGPLVTDYPVYINLIPTWRTNNRPGLKLRGTFDTTQHTTDNYGSAAKGENGYVVSGAEGRQASWHITVDETGAWISLPFDEVGWHASDGAGPGNYSTVACELTMRTALTSNPTLWRRARRIAADIMGRTAARKGGDSQGSYHQTYAPDRKYCPRAIFDTPNGKAEYQADYATSYTDEKRRMAGGGPTESAPVIGINDIVGTTVVLNFRQAANTSAPIFVTLPIGAELLVTGRPEDAGGYRWLPVRHTLANGDVEGFVAMAGQDGTPYLTMVKDNADPEPKKEYEPVAPVLALLDTDLQKYDTAPAYITENGNGFTFVADVIEFTQTTKAKKYASEESPEVAPPFKAGERVIAAWMIHGKPTVSDGTAALAAPWYLLTGPDVEWIRVPVAGTKRVSDAPLLGDEWETTEPTEDEAAPADSDAS